MMPKIGVTPPLRPMMWRVDNSGQWITHDELECSRCGKKSGQEQRHFHIVFDGKWSAVFCFPLCYDAMRRASLDHEGARTRTLFYYGDLFESEVDETGIRIKVKTTHPCRCTVPTPFESVPEVCQYCYGALPRTSS